MDTSFLGESLLILECENPSKSSRHLTQIKYSVNDGSVPFDILSNKNFMENCIFKFHYICKINVININHPSVTPTSVLYSP